MGAVLLLDLRERLRDLGAFYTDDSCCPRWIALSGGDPRLRPTDFSFYFATGAPPTVALLLCCSLIGFALVARCFYQRRC